MKALASIIGVLVYIGLMVGTWSAMQRELAKWETAYVAKHKKECVLKNVGPILVAGSGDQGQGLADGDC